MYRNVYWDNESKQIAIATWNKNGERCRVNVKFRPYIYIESPAGDAVSIFGKKLIKKDFATPYERTKFIKESGIKHIYENFDAPQQFLLDVFWKQCDTDEFAKYDLRTIFFDIEVDPLPGGEFPNADAAKAEINIITCYDSLDKKYHVFSKNKYFGKNLPENCDFNYSPTEATMLREFIAYWKSNDYPDIVAGWNSNGFDFPYTFNRIIKVLGHEEYLSLSPTNRIETRVVQDKMFRDVVRYDIKGVTLLDWMDVYTKFKVTKQESMKLDFIANKELGVGKVDYKGMTIYEFMEKEWDRFVEYNVQDVKLLVDLENKLKYFKILRMVANLACLNYDKGLMTIPVTNGAIAIRARRKNQKLNTFIRDIDLSVEKAGGYVSSVPGFHKAVVTFDANSLYPNLIISNNISPETKIGMAYFDKGVSVYGTNPDDNVRLLLTNGRQYQMSRAKLNEIIKTKDYIMSANGCILSQEFEGLFPEFMREIYEKRVEDKAKMSSIKKENIKLEEELETLQNRLKELGA